MGPVAVLNSLAPLMLKQTLEHSLVAIFTLARYEERDGVSAWLLIRSVTNVKSWMSSGGVFDTSSMTLL